MRRYQVTVQQKFDVGWFPHAVEAPKPESQNEPCVPKPQL